MRIPPYTSRARGGRKVYRSPREACLSLSPLRGGSNSSSVRRQPCYQNRRRDTRTKFLVVCLRYRACYSIFSSLFFAENDSHPDCATLSIGSPGPPFFLDLPSTNVHYGARSLDERARCNKRDVNGDKAKSTPIKVSRPDRVHAWIDRSEKLRALERTQAIGPTIEDSTGKKMNEQLAIRDERSLRFNERKVEEGIKEDGHNENRKLQNRNRSWSRNQRGGKRNERGKRLTSRTTMRLRAREYRGREARGNAAICRDGGQHLPQPLHTSYYFRGSWCALSFRAEGRKEKTKRGRVSRGRGSCLVERGLFVRCPSK